jgi:hypothetical protein
MARGKKKENVLKAGDGGCVDEYLYQEMEQENMLISSGGFLRTTTTTTTLPFT